MSLYKEKIQAIQEDLLQDLASLIEIESYRDLTSKKEGAPFGDGIKQSFVQFGNIAKRLGFLVEDIEGYAMHACTSLDKEYVGVLCHLDVVEAGDVSLWNTPPYSLTIQGDMMYGRGVNDDKGPLLAALYAAYLVNKEHKLSLPIRIIAGGAEETTWECVTHYFNKHPQPKMAFLPDGNFPIVNGEKGILQFTISFPKDKREKTSIISHNEMNYVCDTIQMKVATHLWNKVSTLAKTKTQKEYQILTYEGKRSLSRNPQRGVNALWKWAHDMVNSELIDSSLYPVARFIEKYLAQDLNGDKLGIAYQDEEMGETSICPMGLEEQENQYVLYIDYRYHKSVVIEEVIKRIQTCIAPYAGTFSIYKEKRCLFVDQQSPLITSLQAAYEKVMHTPAEVLTKGGASYARCLEVGVAFGATFEGEDPKPHMPNEQMPISSLLKACEIYCEALEKLCK